MKDFSVDRFLGINEAADSQRELKSGQAAKMENFTVTDGGNLTLRPGVVPLNRGKWDTVPDFLDRAMPVYAGGQAWILGWRNQDGKGVLCLMGQAGCKVWTLDKPIERIFLLGGQVWILQNGQTDIRCLRMRPAQEGFGDPEEVEAYVPLVRSACSATGEGQNREDLNILTDRFRLEAVGDGVSAAYKLSDAGSVESVLADGKAVSGSFQNGVYTFSEPPEEGTRLQFICTVSQDKLGHYRKQLMAMAENTIWGEESDNRCFFWGDGSNTCLYTETPQYGQGLYLPAGNRLTADHSAAPVTGLFCHYSRLLVFKPDGVDVVIPTAGQGFYLRPVSRQFGNDSAGQLQLVENSPRSFTKGGIYDWRLTQSAYRDERYAVRISDCVSRTLGELDVSRFVTCDDGVSKTYYVFANDDAGTVLVHRYGLDVWTVYRSRLTKNVTAAFLWGKQPVFLADGQLWTFDPSEAYDIARDGEKYAIPAVWESGYLDFGMPRQRKYCSQILLSLLSRSGTDLNITVRTDRQSGYPVKNLRSSLLDFGRMDFSRMSFVTFVAPRVHRVKLKVRKFVYYKLILRLDKPGAVATVLGYEQLLRGGAGVK